MSFDKLRMSGLASFPFVVSLSNHERHSPLKSPPLLGEGQGGAPPSVLRQAQDERIPLASITFVHAHLESMITTSDNDLGV